MTEDLQTHREVPADSTGISRTRVHRELDLKTSLLADQITKCAASVRLELGRGWPKPIYEEALAVELSLNGIRFERKKQSAVVFRGRHIGDHYFAFVIEGTIVVELTSSVDESRVRTADFRSYLDVCNIASGLILDFGADAVGVRHIGREVDPVIPNRTLPHLTPDGEDSITSSSPSHTTTSNPPGTDAPKAVLQFDASESSNRLESQLADVAGETRSRSGIKWWMASALLTLAGVAVTVAAIFVPLGHHGQAERSVIENLLKASGYLDTETCKNLSDVLASRSGDGTANRVATTVNNLFRDLSDANLDALQSEATTEAMRTLKDLRDRDRHGVLVVLHDTVKVIRDLCDPQQMFAEALDSSGIRTRHSQWQARIAQLRQNTLLPAKPNNLEYLLYVLSRKAENEAGVRLSMLELPKHSLSLIQHCTVGDPDQVNALCRLAKMSALPASPSRERDGRKAEIFSNRSEGLNR